jgi:hypothetical protein
MNIPRTDRIGSTFTVTLLMGLLHGGLWPAASEAQVLDRLQRQAQQAGEQVEELLSSAAGCTSDEPECVENAEAQKEPVMVTDEEGNVVNGGRFTGSVVGWPQSGSRTELSGPAYLVESPQGHFHILLCDENWPTPMDALVVVVAGAIASGVGEYPLGVHVQAWGWHWGRILSMPNARFQRFNEGVVTITEAVDGGWSGSVSARPRARPGSPRSDRGLDVSFHAVPAPLEDVASPPTRAHSTWTAAASHLGESALRNRCGTR